MPGGLRRGKRRRAEAELTTDVGYLRRGASPWAGACTGLSRCAVDGKARGGLSARVALNRNRSTAGLDDTSSLQNTARRLGEACVADQVILFGSRARGQARADSDVDLALILPDGSDTRARLNVAQRLLWPRTFPIDLVAIPASVWARKATLLARQISTHGVVLYDRRVA